MSRDFAPRRGSTATSDARSESLRSVYGRNTHPDRIGIQPSQGPSRMSARNGEKGNTGGYLRRPGRMLAHDSATHAPAQYQDSNQNYKSDRPAGGGNRCKRKDRWESASTGRKEERRNRNKSAKGMPAKMHRLHRPARCAHNACRVHFLGCRLKSRDGQERECREPVAAPRTS